MITEHDLIHPPPTSGRTGKTARRDVPQANPARAAVSAPYRVEVSEGRLGDLWPLVREWQETCTREPAILPFLAPAWIVPWIANFAPKARLVIATVRSDQGLVAVLPFVQTRLGPPIIGIKQLVQPGNAHSAVNDMAAIAGLPEEVLNTLWRSLQTYSDWDLISYRYAWEDGPLLSLRGIAEDAGDLVLTRVTHESPYLELGPDFDLSRLPRAKEVRRCMRNLDRTGTVTVLHHHQPGQDDVLRFARLEAMGWKGETRTAMLHHPEEFAFYTAIMTTTTAGFTPVIDELRLNGDTIAMSLGIEKNGVFYGIKTSYDPAHRKHGPGHVLLFHTASRLAASGARRVELLGTRDAYKAAWTASAHTGHHILVFRAGLRGRLLHYATRWLIPAVRSWRVGRQAREYGRG